MKRGVEVFGLLSLFIGIVLLGFGCSREPVSPLNSTAGEEISSTAFSKGGWKNQLVDQKTVTPDQGETLKAFGMNMNFGFFKVKNNNVNQPTEVKLTKKSVVKNEYLVEPFGLTMPAGINIILSYDHSPLPMGVNETDLAVFLKKNGGYVRLASSVNKGRMEVSAVANETGEFVLGAYDCNGDLQIIEGEYGVRRERMINHKKGGRIALGYGSYVEIPKNALNNNTLIGIIATRETIRGTENGKAFAFTPHGTVFNIPITLVLSWEEMAGEPVDLYYHNEQTGEWELTSEGVWDYENHTVTLYVPHFSRYALAISR
ncbi:MAG: hypothetical protein Kow0037_11190 [Calditrichia bacterium]